MSKLRILSTAAEENALAVACPPDDGRSVRVKRKTLRGPSAYRHQIDVIATIVLTGERDPSPIRREPRIQLLCRIRREPVGAPFAN
jgi:hypothetical protein